MNIDIFYVQYMLSLNLCCVVPALAAAIICSAVALGDAGVEMYDLVSACSLVRNCLAFGIMEIYNLVSVCSLLRHPLAFWNY